MIKVLILIVLSLSTISAIRSRCVTTPDDYILHQRDSGNFGTTIVPGYITNEAHYFNGEGAYRDFGTTNLGGALSFSAWVKYENFNYWSRIMDFNNGGFSDNILLANDQTSNTFIFDVASGGEWNRIKHVNGILKNTWHHIAATINENGEKKLYIDGVKFGQVSDGNQSRPCEAKTRAFSYLGRSAFAGDEYFQGIIDDFRIYDRVLSKEEVKCLADVCSSECFAHCENDSENCLDKYEGDLEVQDYHDTCPYPQDAVLSQEQATNSGTTGVGPFSSEAFLFDGAGQSAEFGQQELGGPVSFAFWGKMQEGGRWQRFLDFGIGPGQNNVLFGQFEDSNSACLRTFYKNSFNDYILEQSIEFGVWQHWAVTIDSTGQQFVFRDGYRYGAQTQRGQDHGFVRQTRTNNYLGLSNWGNDSSLTGAIDGFQFFERVLKAEEIACMARSTTSCKGDLEFCAVHSEHSLLNSCAVIYTECNYGGEMQEICDEMPELDPQEIRAIHVPQGLKFSLFNGLNFENQVAVFYESIPCLTDINFQDPEDLEAHHIVLQQKKKSLHTGKKTNTENEAQSSQTEQSTENNETNETVKADDNSNADQQQQQDQQQDQQQQDEQQQQD